jgi:hypothetical protein
MKTLKIIIVLCFISVLAFNDINAQPPVIKIVGVGNIGGQYLSCTGDYLWGEITAEIMIMPNQLISKIRNATVIGTDENGVPSGNVYELSQTVVRPQAQGSDYADFENTGTFRLNGKVIAVFHYGYHITINANGEVTAEFFNFKIDCK